MAHLDLAIAAAERPAASAFTPRHDPVPGEETRLGPLEWSVVAVARKDRVSSLRNPGRLSTALGNLFGTRSNPRLADPRLEALRRLAVLAWHHGFALPVSEIRAFLAAGFTVSQYETVLASISAARLDRKPRP
jgi:hypothetical protein